MLNVQNIPIDKLTPNPWNPNRVSDEMMLKLKNTIKRHGYIQPIIVRVKGEGYEIVDGEHRFRLFRDELKAKEIPAVVLEGVSDTDAKLITLTINGVHGENIPLKYAELIDSLSIEIRLEDLAKLLPETESELKHLQELIQFPLDDLAEAIEEEVERVDKDAPRLIQFVVYKNQEETINSALEKATVGISAESRTKKAEALEKICKHCMEAK